MADETEVRAALAQVVDPGTGADIVSGGQVKALTVRDGEVSFVLEVDAGRAAAMEPLRQAAEAAVKAVSGVTVVRAVMTAHAEAGQAAARGAVPDLGLKDFTPKPKAPEGPKPLPGVKHVVGHRDSRLDSPVVGKIEPGIGYDLLDHLPGHTLHSLMPFITLILSLRHRANRYTFWHAQALLSQSTQMLIADNQ